MRLTNEARSELRAKLKAAIAAAGDQDAITPAMVNVAIKSDLLSWAARYGVLTPQAASLAIDAEVKRVAAGEPDSDEADETEAQPQPDEGSLDALEILAQRDVAELQRLIAVMDGPAFKARALDIARLAHKPAETIEIQASQPAIAGQPQPIPQARRNGKKSLNALFGVQGALGKIMVDVWTGGANVPARDPHYVWTKDAGLILAKALVRNGDGTRNNVFLVGPAGTGKTSFAEQVCAVLGRPFFRISFHGQLEASEIMGQRIITPESGMVWADGLLPMAMQSTGALILCDELDRARPGMLQCLQQPLDRGQVTFPETGHTVKAADGVVFLCAGNTNGTGDSTGQYTAAHQSDRATLDRMSDTVMVDYLAPDKEASLLVAKTGCNAETAALLVHFAGVTRLDVAKGELPHGMGLRRLASLAQSLVLGADPAVAVQTAMLNTVGSDEREKLTLLVKTHLSPSVIRKAMRGENVLAGTPVGTGRGANDFTAIPEA